MALRIFEKGLETYGDEIEFVLRYLGFLISVNSENSASIFLECCLAAHHLSTQMLELFSSGSLQHSRLSVLVPFGRDEHVMSTSMVILRQRRSLKREYLKFIPLICAHT